MSQNYVFLNSGVQSVFGYQFLIRNSTTCPDTDIPNISGSLHPSQVNAMKTSVKLMPLSGGNKGLSLRTSEKISFKPFCDYELLKEFHLLCLLLRYVAPTPTKGVRKLLFEMKKQE